MGSGQKAWMEELEQEALRNMQERFRTHKEYEIIDTLQYVVDDLQRFIASDPSLTKTQWARIETSLTKLKALI